MPINAFTPNPEEPFLPPPGLDRLPPFQLERPVFSDLRWGPAHVRVLIMSDGSSYGEADGFGLGIVLADAFDPAHPDHPDYVRFEFTKAHRTTAAGVSAGYANFHFTAGSLDDSDELWLFGYTPGAPYLSAAEIAVIEAFMDRGGGVLAMGDHQDLGLGLCGGIKRVRSMRKWWFDSPPPPAGMQRAPDTIDLSRNDTVQAPTLGGNVNAGDQGDATPQPIYPNYRYRWTYWRPLSRVKFPHPVLCGPRGAIRVMADHQHEGDCIMPDPAFAGEYPGGVPVEIVARGRNVVGRGSGANQITDPRAFGLIGAWDGHQPGADQGRVLVDSTWHHWFNINLTGLRAENGTEYKDVLAYFRNCAIWLAPKDEQARMRRAGTLITLLTPRLIEEAVTWRELLPTRFYPIGVFARDALGRIAPQCQSAAWFFDLVAPLLPDRLHRMFDADVLEKAVRLERLEGRTAALVADAAATTLYGGAINAIAVELNKYGLDKMGEMHERLDEIARSGAKAAMRQVNEELAEAAKVLQTLAR